MRVPGPRKTRFEIRTGVLDLMMIAATGAADHAVYGWNNALGIWPCCRLGGSAYINAYKAGPILIIIAGLKYYVIPAAGQEKRIVESQRNNIIVSINTLITLTLPLTDFNRLIRNNMFDVRSICEYSCNMQIYNVFRELWEHFLE